MDVHGTIRGTLTSPGTISGSLSGSARLTGEISIPSAADVERYEGAYEFTPTGETQTIDIINKMATDNIVINPIPSNYGLITYDGSGIRVS